jgi:hypothetical protein
VEFTVVDGGGEMLCIASCQCKFWPLGYGKWLCLWKVVTSDIGSLPRRWAQILTPHPLEMLGPSLPSVLKSRPATHDSEHRHTHDACELTFSTAATTPDQLKAGLARVTSPEE